MSPTREHAKDALSQRRSSGIPPLAEESGGCGVAEAELDAAALVDKVSSFKPTCDQRVRP
jgi:hypothetical protein